MDKELKIFISFNVKSAVDLQKISILSLVAVLAMLDWLLAGRLVAQRWRPRHGRPIISRSLARFLSLGSQLAGDLMLCFGRQPSDFS
jgi:hypothetical protein